MKTIEETISGISLRLSLLKDSLEILRSVESMQIPTYEARIDELETLLAWIKTEQTDKLNS